MVQRLRVHAALLEEPEFSSQHPHGVAHSHCNSSSKNLMSPASWGNGTHVHIFTHRQTHVPPHSPVWRPDMCSPALRRLKQNPFAPEQAGLYRVQASMNHRYDTQTESKRPQHLETYTERTRTEMARNYSEIFQKKIHYVQIHLNPHPSWH